MKELILKRITILSDTLKSGSQYEFSERITIITADDNSVGKSTLVKMVLWTFGCSPYFAVDWKKYDCKSVVDFDIGQDSFSISRYKSSFNVFKNSIRIGSFDKIVGSFSDFFASLVGFEALLPKKGTFILETPPPSFYFLPFYIDQKHSWVKPWSSFDRLSQYSSWQRTVLSFHCGFLNEEHFHQDKKIYSLREETAEIRERISNVSKAKDILFEEVMLSREVFVKPVIEEGKPINQDISHEIEKLSKIRESANIRIKEVTVELADIDSQILTLNRIMSDLEKDYEFVVEHFNDGQIECPTCGTKHNNSLLNRSDFLVDKTIAEKNISNLMIEKEKIYLELKELKVADRNALLHISKIENDIKSIRDDVSNNIAKKILSNRINTFTSENESVILDKEKNEKDTVKLRNSILSSAQKSELKEVFMGKFTHYITKLRVNIDLDSVKSPFDYKKIYDIGGAAEDSRAILAYHLAIFEHVRLNSSEVIPPFIIDTPNQHEQSKLNYEKISTSLKSLFSTGGQFILCAMENTGLQELKKEAKHIFISEDKLMNDSDYEGLIAATNHLFS